jgi:predicted ATP-binding protein involved in virulence
VLDDPAAEAQAVVLIDEIDLHLHPKWQRQIVHNLEAAFPRCQFIATTHSPQVIGEVPRNRVCILTDSGAMGPSVAYGADSNWILDHVMEGASSGTAEARIIEDEAEEAMAEGQLQKARAKLEELRRLVDGETGELARLEGSLSSLELLARGAEGEAELCEDD